MEFNLRVEMDNAAFEDYPEDELIRILSKVAGALTLRTSGTIKDINGNTVGEWEIR